VAVSARPALRRAEDGRLLLGVCAGIARYFGWDPLAVRVVFVIAAAAGGVGFVVYALVALLVPAGATGAGVATRLADRRAGLEVAAGAALLLVAALLVLRATGIWFSDAIVWPLVLVGAGAGLLWRGTESTAEGEAPPATAAEAEPREPRDAAERAAVLSRTGLGVALVIAAGLVFLQAIGALSTARNVVLGVLVAAVVLGVIFAPVVARLARSLSAERAERIRSEERAEMAAHLHDSVLQTLALVQKRADEPREVAALARRQERELRAWLAGRDPGAATRTLRAALEAAASETEDRHGAEVEVVVVGDAELDDALAGVVAAAREAMVNAARFAPGSPVDVYAEATPERVEVFVRDRGPGFDPAAVPEDRRGVRESIVGRMARHGGRATVRSDAGGTEVELVLEREPA
jgi:signal transduction histidine kinase